MSDLLAPVLAEIQHEVDVYWCFVGLMQRTIFVSSPKDCDMDKQLVKNKCFQLTIFTHLMGVCVYVFNYKVYQAFRAGVT